MGVKLRYQTLKNGGRSYYLDIWHDGKRTREFLKARIEKTRKNADQSKSIKKIAEEIRNQREQELLAERYNVAPANRRKINFTDFYQQYVNNYTKKDIRKLEASLKHFKAFFGEKSISSFHLTKSKCEGFLNYLTENLRGETPSTYFTAFRKVIRSAIDNNVLQNDPTKTIRVSSGDSVLLKDVLTMDELQLLTTVHCGNDQVKRAFLFCCFTGMGYKEVKALQWSQTYPKDHIAFSKKVRRRFPSLWT